MLCRQGPDPAWLTFLQVAEVSEVEDIERLRRNGIFKCEHLAGVSVEELGEIGFILGKRKRLVNHFDSWQREKQPPQVCMAARIVRGLPELTLILTVLVADSASPRSGTKGVGGAQAPCSTSAPQQPRPAIMPFPVVARPHPTKSAQDGARGGAQKAANKTVGLPTPASVLS